MSIYFKFNSLLINSYQPPIVSSNSSFTESVRRSCSFYSSLSLSHINSLALTIYNNIDFGTQTQNLPSSEYSFQFHSCTWDNCCSEPAGAISCDQSDASLIVMNCKFNNCNSTSGVTATQAFNGGAICVIGISTFIVSSSSFYNCRAPQTIHDNGGSGGLYIYYLKKTFSLSSSDFISCLTGSSGAAIYFVSSSTPKLDIETVLDCRVINCKAQVNSPDGGGMCLWEWTDTLKCTGCLFSGCSSTSTGGGLNFNFAANSESYPIKFCFFIGNTASYVGNDIFLYLLPNNDNLVLKHCFTLSNSKRIGYQINNQVYTTDN